MGYPVRASFRTVESAARVARALAACALVTAAAFHTGSAARRAAPAAALFEFDEASQTLDARSATLSLQGGTYLASTGRAGGGRLVARTGLSAAFALKLGRDTVASLCVFDGQAGYLGDAGGVTPSELRSLKLSCRLDRHTTATLGRLWGDVDATSIGVARGISAGRTQIGGWLWASAGAHACPQCPLASGYGLTASYHVARGLESGVTVDGPLGQGWIEHTALQVNRSLGGGDAGVLWHRYGTRTRLTELRFWREINGTQGIGLYVTDHATAGLWTRWRH